MLPRVFERGYLTIARIRGAEVRFHWTTPLGALFFSQFRFVPGFWVGFVLLVVIHELGHAVLVWRGGLHVTSIDVHGLGGLCRYVGHSTDRWRSVIAWGGVAAQALALVVALAVSELLPPSHNPYVVQLLAVFIRTNVYLILFNLIPIPPFDGAEAWKLVRMPRASRSGDAPKAAWRNPAKLRTKRDLDDIVVSEEEAERITREALTQAAADAARKRREGQLH